MGDRKWLNSHFTKKFPEKFRQTFPMYHKSGDTYENYT